MAKQSDNKVVARAQKWMDEVWEPLNDDGDFWNADYAPIFNDRDEIVGTEFNSEIEMRGVSYGDEESSTSHIRIDGLDESAVKAICELHNNFCEIIAELCAEVDRLEEEIQTATDKEQTRRFLEKILALSDKGGRRVIVAGLEAAKK